MGNIENSKVEVCIVPVVCFWKRWKLFSLQYSERICADYINV